MRRFPGAHRVPKAGVESEPSWSKDKGLQPKLCAGWGGQAYREEEAELDQQG